MRLSIRFTVLLLFSLVLLGLCIPAAPALAAGEPELYVGIESFTWREFDDAGNQLLKESGPRFAVGFTYLHEFDEHLTLKPRIELFGGSVDYKGAACDVSGNCFPDDSTTHYFGVKFEGDAGYRIWTAKNVNIEPFGGLGIRAWARDIDDSVLSDGTLALGYTEHWTTFYGRLGVRAETHMARHDKLFAELGVKLPISSENYIDDVNVSYSAITLHPGNKASLFAEAGVKVSKFRISAFYDSMRFKKSDITYEFDPILDAIVFHWQPKSDSDMFGIRMGVAFY